MATNKYLRENDEMRAHIAQLKKDLEQEKNLVKQAHRDKVAEVKRAREEEGVRLRSELESQLEKARRDARNEKLSMERAFKQQLQFEILQKIKEKDEEVGKCVCVLYSNSSQNYLILYYRLADCKRSGIRSVRIWRLKLQKHVLKQ